MGRVDLHLHTTASDGRLSPAELVREVAARGLSVIAITDHDSVDGIVPALEAARDFPRLKVIPGVEINTDVPGGEVHILGYFIDYTDTELLLTLGDSRNSREKRARKMITKLNEWGVQITWPRIVELAKGGSIGRPHVAQAMLEKGYISSIKEAFDKYIGQGKPCYVEREKKSPVEAVLMVLHAGGLPVLAHPFTTSDPEGIVSDLKVAGLVGIEIYYNGYSPGEINQLLIIAEKYGLLATGGSDYHAPGVAANSIMGEVNVPTAVADRLIALARQRKLKFAL